MRDSRLFGFPLILALLGVTLAGCAGVGTGRNLAMGPAPTVPGEAGTLNAGNTGGQERICRLIHIFRNRRSDD